MVPANRRIRLRSCNGLTAIDIGVQAHKPVLQNNLAVLIERVDLNLIRTRIPLIFSSPRLLMKYPGWPVAGAIGAPGDQGAQFTQKVVSGMALSRASAMSSPQLEQIP